MQSTGLEHWKKQHEEYISANISAECESCFSFVQCQSLGQSAWVKIVHVWSA